MRVTGGVFKRYTFNPPRNLPARPLSDFVRTALGNILSSHFEFDEMRALDLFAGTGSFTYEVLSRGASEVAVVEKDQRCVDFIDRTLRALGMRDKVRVYRMDVFRFLQWYEGLPFRVVFSGAPYRMHHKLPQLVRQVLSSGLLEGGGWLIVEHSSSVSLTDAGTPWQVRRYGSTALSIFTAK